MSKKYDVKMDYRIAGYFRWCKFSHKMDLEKNSKIKIFVTHVYVLRRPRLRAARPDIATPMCYVHLLTRAPLERLCVLFESKLSYRNMEDLASFSIFYQTALYTYVHKALSATQ